MEILILIGFGVCLIILSLYFLSKTSKRVFESLYISVLGGVIGGFTFSVASIIASQPKKVAENFLLLSFIVLVFAFLGFIISFLRKNHKTFK